MEKNIIRPRIFHKRIRTAILLVLLVFFVLGMYALGQSLINGHSSRFDIRDWSFLFWFVLCAFMILVYWDQEQKAKYYIRWTDSDLYYKLDPGPERRLDLSQVKRVNANYSKVFFYMKDGSVKLVNFYSLDPRFKDVQKAMSINEKLVV
ncbi:hypothetical protein KUV50_05140 [Membranicola marinus]|uniref:Uncharacterized protein n=1 Tax=Membranihabitans marinus TaxID=1227546 RepID=A0A953HVW4_9BACT|nr:hypothetical protein [Membranihabitans marinus]MBY5957511.1 hypothetical protein [Membranihabitans marinus]